MSQSKRERILQRILDERDVHSLQLPDIGPRKSWWSKLYEDSALQNAVEFFKDFLNEAFRGLFKNKTSLDLSFAELLFVIVGWIMIVSVAGLLIWVLYKLLRVLINKRVKISSSSPQAEFDNQLVELEFLKNINELIDKGNYSEAFRLRWKFLLKKTRVLVSVTPYELSDFAKEDVDGQRKSRLSILYGVMFGGVIPNASQINDFLISCASFEEKHKVKRALVNGS
ncbi:MAG TPA: hypothetical protein PKA63_00390 [Oligoflexia bacterium]|nr:hypothetical protein [Oligoflexia bacterium]HMP47107.1 hypothetical protein [Oligoflexia bacterium]